MKIGSRIQEVEEEMINKISRAVKLREVTSVEQLIKKTNDELCGYAADLGAVERRLVLVFKTVSLVAEEGSTLTHTEYKKYPSDMTISELLEHINLLEKRIMEKVEIIKARKF